MTVFPLSTKPFSNTTKPTDCNVAARKIGIAATRARASCPMKIAPKLALKVGRTAALDVRASSVGTLLRRAEDAFRREMR